MRAGRPRSQDVALCQRAGRPRSQDVALCQRAGRPRSQDAALCQRAGRPCPKGTRRSQDAPLTGIRHQRVGSRAADLLRRFVEDFTSKRLPPQAWSWRVNGRVRAWRELRPVRGRVPPLYLPPLAGRPRPCPWRQARPHPRRLRGMRGLERGAGAGGSSGRGEDSKPVRDGGMRARCHKARKKIALDGFEARPRRHFRAKLSCPPSGARTEAMRWTRLTCTRTRSWSMD